MSDPNRFILFKNLRYLFGMVNPRYKVISYRGVKLDILDLLVSSLYLAAIQSQYKSIYEVIPFRILPVRKKISQFPKRLWAHLEYILQERKRSKLVQLNKTQNTKADIVFWPVEPTHLDQQIPVAKILTEKGVQFNFITNQIKVYKNIRQEGFNAQFIDIKPYSIPLNNFDIIDLRDQIDKDNFKGSAPIIDKKVVDFVSFTIGNMLDIVSMLICYIFEFIDMVKPRIIVVGNDLTLEGRVATRICQAIGINCACIMHGSIEGELWHGLHIVDNYFVYGQLAKDYLVSLGIQPQNLIVSGAPYIDRLNVAKKSVHPMLMKKLRLKNDDGFVLLALSQPGYCPSYEHFNCIVESVVKLSAHKPEINIIAKLHRGDNKKNYRKIKRQYPDNRLHVVENGRKGYPQNIFDWLNGCKLAITGASTVALEAMLMNVPVITVDYMNEYRGVDFIEMGTTIHVKTESELFEAIQNVLHSSNKYKDVMRKAQQYINTYFYKPNGRASERIADYLAHIVMEPI
ncbi:UDP-N-acetylglucosamine 2-epimerase [candidate division KSB1 bacterium]|nr:UDP-N-acetylglucosamine 2-epimerase [candidate division KSB1 bacterium]